MKKCIYCGHALQKTDVICPKCKAAVPDKDKEPEKDSKDKEE